MHGYKVFNLLGSSLLISDPKSIITLSESTNLGWIVKFKYDRSLFESFKKERFESRVAELRFLTLNKYFFLLLRILLSV